MKCDKVYICWHCIELADGHSNIHQPILAHTQRDRRTHTQNNTNFHSIIHSIVFFSLFFHFLFCFASHQLLHSELFAVTAAGTLCCLHTTHQLFWIFFFAVLFFMADINRCWTNFPNLISIDRHWGISRAPKQYTTNNNHGFHGNMGHK